MDNPVVAAINTAVFEIMNHSYYLEQSNQIPHRIGSLLEMIVVEYSGTFTVEHMVNKLPIDNFYNR